MKKVFFFYDEPVAHAPKLFQFIMKKKIADKGYKVLINGEGGDEIFGGYPRHYKYFIYEHFFKGKRSIPKLFKENCEIYTNKKFSDTIKNTNLFIENTKKDLHDVEHLGCFSFTNKKIENLNKDSKFFIKPDLQEKNFFKKILYSQIFKRDLPYCLKIEDRNSMAFSVEGRTPLVDHILVEYIFSRKSSYFLHDGKLKFMLRNIFKDKLPKDHFKKKKVGSPGSETYLIKNFYKEKLLDTLNSTSFINEYIDNTNLKKNIEENGIRPSLSPFLFRVMSYFIWKENIKNQIKI